jgi:hypothetical protein
VCAVHNLLQLPHFPTCPQIQQAVAAAAAGAAPGLGAGLPLSMPLSMPLAPSSPQAVSAMALLPAPLSTCEVDPGLVCEAVAWYFLPRFPQLVLGTYLAVAKHAAAEPAFALFFSGPLPRLLGAPPASPPQQQHLPRPIAAQGQGQGPSPKGMPSPIPSPSPSSAARRTGASASSGGVSRPLTASPGPADPFSLLLGKLRRGLECPLSPSDARHVLVDPVTTPCCGYALAVCALLSSLVIPGLFAHSSHCLGSFLCSRSFCRECLPIFLDRKTEDSGAGAGLTSPRGKDGKDARKSPRQTAAVTVCFCGRKTGEEDRAFLGRAVSNQSLLSVLETLALASATASGSGSVAVQTAGAGAGAGAILPSSAQGQAQGLGQAQGQGQTSPLGQGQAQVHAFSGHALRSPPASRS